MPTKRRRYHEKNDFERSQLTILPSLIEDDVLDSDIYSLIAPYATGTPKLAQAFSDTDSQNSGGLTSASFIIDTTTLSQPAPTGRVSNPPNPSLKSRHQSFVDRF
jgi:hypothetical protein